MVDILLATFNGEKYLREQLDSLLDQTYQKIRILIHDDGSSDGTVDIIKEYVSNFPSKISFIDDGSFFGDPARNFAHLIKQSTADYIMFSDQDDVWNSDKVRVMLGAMKVAEKRYRDDEKKTYGALPLLVFSDYELVDVDLNPIKVDEKKLEVAKHYTTFNRLIVQNYVSGCTMMINRAAALLFGEYDDRMDMHDWWIALYVSAMGRVMHLPSKLMKYRQHSENTVGAKNIKSFKYRISKIMNPETKNGKNDAFSAMDLMNERFGDILPDKSKEMVDVFISMKTMSKPARIKTLLKYKFLKSDVIRALGQIVYI